MMLSPGSSGPNQDSQRIDRSSSASLATGSLASSRASLPASSSTQIIAPTTSGDEISLDKPLFPEPSNILARALHRALVGRPQGVDDYIEFDRPKAMWLLEISTPAELVEAEECLRRDMGYSIDAVIACLPDGEKLSFGRRIEEKRSGVIGISPREQEALVRQIGLASVYRNGARGSVQENGEILHDYLGRAVDAVADYPRILARWEDDPTRFALDRSSNQLIRSCQDQEWPDLAVPGEPRNSDPREVLEKIAPAIDRAHKLVGQFVVSPWHLDHKKFGEVLEGLDFANRLMRHYAYDFCEDFMRDFRRLSKTPRWLDPFIAPPKEVCHQALATVFYRKFLIDRSIGISGFVATLRASQRGNDSQISSASA